jgi:cell wall-associated protease
MLFFILTLLSTATSTQLQEINIPSRIMAFTNHSEQVLVTVIDTGIDFNNNRLKSSLFPYPTSLGNQDHHGHGTHVSAIIANALEKTYYSQIKIMGINARDNFFPDLISPEKLQDGIKFAIQNHARIINLSLGVKNNAILEEFEAIKEAEAAGILVIVAAGNDQERLDSKNYSFYPASYHLSNMIVVGSVDQDEKLADGSNYGLGVDISAMGVDVASFSTHNNIVKVSGTSQATAVITKVAAHLLASYPSLNFMEVKAIIQTTAKQNSNLQGMNAVSGVVDEKSALSLAKIYLERKSKSIASIQ